MTWNYRVIRHVGPNNKVCYRIHEVYYEGERVVTIAEEASAPSGGSVEELNDDFYRMRAAFDKPVLDYSEL